MPAPSSVPGSGPAGHLWYVEASGVVWGPYTEARMVQFVAEGRVTAATAVSPWIAGPFGPAGQTPEFAERIGRRGRPAAAVQPRPDVPGPTPPVSATAAVATPPAVARAPLATSASAAASLQASSAPRALLVWASLASLAPGAFEAALGAYGPFVAIRPGLWLIQGRTGASALRNALSRRLKAGDALMVVEAPLEQVAWFNLDRGSERDLRRLWAGAG